MNKHLMFGERHVLKNDIWSCCISVLGKAESKGIDCAAAFMYLFPSQHWWLSAWRRGTCF